LFVKRPKCPKAICLRANGVNVFHGNNNGVTKQIKDNYTPHFIGVHCMAHHTNLVVQTLSKLPFCHGRIQNFVGEDHLGLPYKTTSQVEL
jgi:hypothetical protein